MTEMIRLAKRFERLIIGILLLLMMSILALTLIDLAWILVKDILSPPVFLLEIEELLDLFGLIMLALIGVELLETVIKTYARPSTEHVHIVLAVALIAVARKIILFDFKQHNALDLAAVAVLVLALGIAYALVRRVNKTIGGEAGHGDAERVPASQSSGIDEGEGAAS